jgi:CRISPR-associated protein Csd1
MILQALVRYYDILAQEGELPIQGYSRAKVSYALVLSGEGELTGVLPLKSSEMVGKKSVDRPRLMLVPEQVLRSSGVSANFLCDNSSYMLGIDQKGKLERSQKCFEAAAKLTTSILATAEGDSAGAIRKFFASWKPQDADSHSVVQEWKEITEGDNLVFFVNGKFASEDSDIQKAWSNYISQKEVWMERQCLVTGKVGPIARLHPTIKGVQGAQSSGASIVSFKSPSNNSYGLENGENAPVAEGTTFAYTTVLNYMLSSRKYKVSLDQLVIVKP